MKKTNLLLCMLFGGLAYSQVGVNTSSPKATLDVTAKNTDGSTAEGLIVPRLVGNELYAAIGTGVYGMAQHGAIVYVSTSADPDKQTGQTSNVNDYGFYYYDGYDNKWMKMGDESTIYRTDGILSGSRHMTMDGNNLGFTGGRLGMGTASPDPSALLDLTSTSLGFLPPRMTKAQMDGILHPSQGLMIYCTDCFPNSSITGCLMVNDSQDPLVSNWGSMCSTNVSTGHVVLQCGSATTSGTANSGIALSGVTVSVPYTDGNGGTYPSLTINSTGVTGLTAHLDGGSFSMGSGNLVFSISGTASGAGTASFSISLGNDSCSFIVNVSSAVANVGSLSCGSSVFSPASMVQGVAYSGTLSVPYMGGNGAHHPQMSLTSQNGLTFTLPEGDLSTGSGNLVYNISGTPTNAGSMTIPISFGTVASCNISQNVGSQQTVVMCGSSKAWMTHNLGADTSLDPNIPVAGIHGAKYQWGAQTGQAGRYYSQTDDQSNFGAISGWNTTPSANGSWGASKTSQDPCPTGFRVPTQAEWQTLLNNSSVSNYPTTWGAASNTQYGNAKVLTCGANKLTLPASGNRIRSTGALYSRGWDGSYWSSTENGSYAYSLHFTSGSVDPANYYFRTYGFSVRCIAE